MDKVLGLYTECAVSDLPNGASPLCINDDFIIGSVQPRPGKQNAYIFEGMDELENAGHGASIPGQFAPNEVPWSNPNNIVLDSPPSYASVTLNGNGKINAPFVNSTPPIQGPVSVSGAGPYIATFNASAVGDIFAVAIQTSPGATGLSIADTAGLTWIPIVGGPEFGVWLALANLASVTSTTITVTVSGGPASAQMLVYVLQSTVMGLYQDIVSNHSGNGVTASAALDLLTPSSLQIAASPVNWNSAVAVFLGTVSSVAFCFVGSDGATLQDQGTSVDWATRNGTGGAGRKLQAWTFSGVQGPLPGITGVGAFDRTTASAGTTASVTTSPLTPLGTELGMFFAANERSFVLNGGWSNFDGGGLMADNFIAEQLISVATGGSATLGIADNWAANLALFNYFGTVLPPKIQTNAILSGAFSSPAETPWPSPNTAGNQLWIFYATAGGQAPALPVISDTNGNVYTMVASALRTVSPTVKFQTALYVATNILGGSNQTIADPGGQLYSSTTIVGWEVQAGAPGTGAFPDSQILQATNFPFVIPSTSGVLGFQVLVTGHQTNLASDAVLNVTINAPFATADTPVMIAQLPASDGTITLGTPQENWGLALTPALLNNPNFGVSIFATTTAGELVTFDISAVQILVNLTPNPAPNFNYLKTFEQEGGEIFNLALDSNGTMWREDAINNPGVLEAVYTAIEPNTFAQSVTQASREFIALSNLQNGTDIPYGYDGTAFNRFSQVGPGSPPACTTSANTSNIVSITQNPPIPLEVSSHDWLLVSNSPSSHGDFGTPATPGNVMTLTFASGFLVPSYITPGTNIVISGFPTINGNIVNNDPAGITAPKFYTVTSVGQPIPGQQSYDAITFTVNFTTFFNEQTPPGCVIESTLATLTTAAQIPNLEVGDTFQVAGASVAGYDSTWTVITTPNASQLSITSTQLLNNTATYSYVLETGTNPVDGQFISVTLTLNGNGVFNVTRAVIASANASSFTIHLVGPNVSSAPENGAGIIFGTIFTFDAFAIFGNSTGGHLVTTGVIAAGVRQACYSFLTEDGYVSAPSPIETFDITSGASGIQVSNLRTGPPNVIARIVSFTGANGGNFFNIPEPVSVNDNGTVVINTSTYVNNNTATSATFSFSDAVLLAASAIDIDGNNLFETVEVGSSVGFVSYASRVFAIGEQNKLTNLLNWSFDGGIAIVQGNASAGGGGAGSANATYPAGWTVDPAFGGGGSVVASPIFGFAYQIRNATGSTQATYGMIEQGAFQDEFMVPIIEASTTYSVRITAAVAALTTGLLVVDLHSPAQGKSLGTFGVQLNTLTTEMTITTGTLLTTVLAPVPTDLILRLFVDNLPNGAAVIIDRVEIFPTEEPNLSAQLTGSYVNNFEALDQLQGVIDTSSENPQPARAAFVLYDTLYIVKSRSMVSTQDNGTTQPSGWQLRTVSNVVGTDSIYGVDSGEDWALIAGRPGLFFFNGGQPIALSREIQSLWNQINWQYGYTLWVKNDVVNQRILIGVPLKTPNTWLPTGIIPDNANPTTPNVVLELNYKQLNTGNEMADRGEIANSYVGKVLAKDFSRKWSIWTIKSPCAAFLEQANNTAPLFVGNSDMTGKVYSLVNGLLEDDGAAFQQIYISYGFVDTDEEQGNQLGSVRKLYEMMTMVLDGSQGTVHVSVFPNTLMSPYAHELLPPFTMPPSINGDMEIPVNELGSRLFVQLSTNAVGSGFFLSRIVMMCRQDPWSGVRGSNT